MQYLAYFIIIFIFILIILYTYECLKTSQNKSLINNIEDYDKKEKIKQQKSKIHESKSKRKKDNKKKRTRMYHI